MLIDRSEVVKAARCPRSQPREDDERAGRLCKIPEHQSDYDEGCASAEEGWWCGGLVADGRRGVRRVIGQGDRGVQ